MNFAITFIGWSVGISAPLKDFVVPCDHILRILLNDSGQILVQCFDGKLYIVNSAITFITLK
jgi:hypothetical protein